MKSLPPKMRAPIRPVQRPLCVARMNVFYVTRVSTNDQETATQVAALRAAGCERTYREKASGGTVGRARTPSAPRSNPQGRRARSVEALSAVALTARCANNYGTPGRSRSWLRSLTEAIDTTTPAGGIIV
jgi:hypothetical protein